VKKTALVHLIILGLIFQLGNAQSSVRKYTQLGFELDKVLSDQFKPDDPGCAAIVAIRGQIIYKKAFGLSDTSANIPLNTVKAFGVDSSALNSLKLIKREGLELAKAGYKLPDGKDPRNDYGIEINYGSRSTIPILTLRKRSTSDGFYTKTIYVPDDDIYIAVYTSCENNISNDPTQTIFNKVLTEFFGSLDFTDSTNSRLVFYHFLLSVKVLPQGGIIENGKTSHVYINGDTKYLHYTTDGSEPNINSPTYNDNILITKACELKIKVIPSANSDTLKSVSYQYIKGSAPEPIGKINGLKPGLKYTYYEGGWNSLPDFSKLTPKKSGIAQIPDLSVVLKKDSCAIQFDGYIYIDKKEMYNIYSVSDDGSKVFLNDKLIVNNDGAHGSVPEAFLMPLKKGYYPIRVLYFENSGGQELQVGYWIDGNEPKPFTKGMLFHKE